MHIVYEDGAFTPTHLKSQQCINSLYIGS